MEQNIIELENLSFAYGNDEVLKNITLTIKRGDYLGIIGPNGSGKTTLVKIILGLLKPAAGSIKIFGQNISNFKEWSKIGYVPQRIINLDVNFPATAKEVVLMGRYAKRGLLHKINKKDKEIVQQALARVNMLPYQDRLIGDLSGGQQQRIFIARALATEPEIIFLDEPTTSVDVSSREEFYSLLRKLNQESKLTLVLISHDIDAITREVSYVACIDKALICHSQPEEFLKNHDLMLHFGHIRGVQNEHNHQQ